MKSFAFPDLPQVTKSPSNISQNSNVPRFFPLGSLEFLGPSGFTVVNTWVYKFIYG